MPLKLYRRPKSPIWSYRGTVAGDILRGSTKTTNKELAARVISKIESRHFKRHLDGPEKEELTFPQAVLLYLKSGKGSTKRETLYIGRLEDHWKNTEVKSMTPGAIRQSAIDIHPNDSGATRNRQVITVTRAIINHCAELEHCPPIRVRGFAHDKKIKQPITLEWLDTFCAHARPLTAALAVFMFATGCRISEAKRLDWPHIDFQQRTILVIKTKNKKQRLPHMPARLLVLLANLPRDEKPFGCWSESSLRDFWDKDVAKAAIAVPGFVRLTFHSCRHGIATKLLRDKVDVATAGDLIGMSVGVLLSNYAHAMQDTTLIDRVFDTESTPAKTATKENQ